MIKFSTCYFACRLNEDPENYIEFRILVDQGDLYKSSTSRPELIQRCVEGFYIIFENNTASRGSLAIGELIDPFYFIRDGQWIEITEETYLKCKNEFLTLNKCKEMFPVLYYVKL